MESHRKTPEAEARVRSSKIPSSSLSPNVPVLTLPTTRSQPGSPSISSTHQRYPDSSMTSQSYPVFPLNAQPPSGVKIREAVLFTKSPLATSTAPKSQARPKMHLYAADKKIKSAPKDEEFPVVPVEWLVGSPSQTPSDGSSMSFSEELSGDSSEDEIYSFKSSMERTSSLSEPATPDLGRHVNNSACSFLSVGLKALLKVQA